MVGEISNDRATAFAAVMEGAPPVYRVTENITTEGPPEREISTPMPPNGSLTPSVQARDV